MFARLCEAFEAMPLEHPLAFAAVVLLILLAASERRREVDRA